MSALVFYHGYLALLISVTFFHTAWDRYMEHLTIVSILILCFIVIRKADMGYAQA